jgi:hypothetical protein
MKPPRPDVCQRLAEQIRTLESNHRPATQQALNSPLFEAMFERKLSAGSLVELLAETGGSGAWTLGLSFAWQACLPGNFLVIVDGQRRFYPPAAVTLGVDLHRTILVQPARHADALIALRESLRCAAVGSTVGWFDRLSSSDFRRMQLAAENGGGLGVLLRPVQALRSPSFATVRLHVQPEASPDAVRRLRVEVVRWRNGHDGLSAILEVRHEKILVHSSARLADAAPRTATAVASP